MENKETKPTENVKETKPTEKVEEVKETEKVEEKPEINSNPQGKVEEKETQPAVEETSNEASGIKIEDIVTKDILEKMREEIKKEILGDVSKYKAIEQENAELKEKLAESTEDNKKLKDKYENNGDFGTQNGYGLFESGSGSGKKRPTFAEMCGEKTNFD